MAVYSAFYGIGIKEGKMKQRLSWTNRILVGFTLFSMFFGAGNLIFPPFLGYLAGSNLWPAAAGFILSAVCLPVLGVAAVALAGGLDKLAGRVHPGFSVFFTVLIYLAIGPCVAIPRTAGTAYEMAVLPFLGELAGKETQLIFSVLFFCVAVFFAMRPDKLTDRLGKVTGPSLMILIALLLAGCIFWPVGQSGPAAGGYAENPVSQGFVAGYQTMDAMAALNFGIVIALNIRTRGIKSDGALVRETIYSGLIAGGVLALVYCSLAYMGNMGGLELTGAENGVQVLTWVADSLYGRTGMILLAGIFFIACLNVCIGLLSCCSEYFAGFLPGISSRGWTVIFAVISLFISNAGLTGVLKISGPVIEAIYPVSIVLILLAFLNRRLEHFSLAYPCCVGFTAAASICLTLASYWEGAPAFIKTAALLPGAAAGLGWILPAALGCGAGCLCSGLRNRADIGSRRRGEE